MIVRARVLDLTDAETRRALGISEDDLREDAPQQVARCQDVASWAREHGYQGVLAPSAAYEGALTIAVFDEAVLMYAEAQEDRIVTAPPDPRL